jgi:hypothetical protein
VTTFTSGGKCSGGGPAKNGSSVEDDDRQEEQQLGARGTPRRAAGNCREKNDSDVCIFTALKINSASENLCFFKLPDKWTETLNIKVL